MKRATFAVAVLVLAICGSAFFVVPGPKPTRQCDNLAFCFGIAGPWVVVPAHGQATYLFGCPERSKELGPYLLGGSDSRVSSSHVHVWYEGKLGAPIGQQTTQSSLSGLLFHASSDDGRPGSFQPVVGCISLRQASKRSTLSAAPPPVGKGTLSPSLPIFRTHSLVLEPGWTRTIGVACRPKETLVGGWSAIAFGTSGPPTAFRPSTVSLVSTEKRRTARTVVKTSTTVPYLIRIQVGAMCEP
jgi:hypothetical protein